MEAERIQSASDFLFTTASILSEIAYGKYIALEAKAEVERAANLKSDFLANMSHEIRTPMNAVIGMAEMALREELTPTAREYIAQIKSSGNALLNIINDILDFSKIDSGKMDIQPVEYEVLSLFHDVANIVATRLKDKNVELLLKINPTLPRVLYGDNLRVRQILINLANNAVKFTRHGHVDILVDYKTIDDEHIEMTVAVKDTGIGIKKKDLGNLFQSFQQLDSKRNRNIEGTGLGLTISKQLLGLMGGSIHVSSVYEKGSTFSFVLPQKVVDSTPSIAVNNADSIGVIGYFNHPFYAKQFFMDVNSMGVYSMALTEPDCFEEVMVTNYQDIQGKKIYLFMEEDGYDEQMTQILRDHPDIVGVVLTDFFSNEKSNAKNLRIIRKPFSTIHIARVLNNESEHWDDTTEHFEFEFIAPEAKVLIVDDNEINLMVAKGLLDPLKMQIFTATSGKMALEMIDQQMFDLIFMDHMMPELDGVETTRIIRRLHPTYDDVPILALSANAVDGAKDMFLSEGMNDFVAKPIEMKDIVSKLRKWLPTEKLQKSIRKSDTVAPQGNDNPSTKIVIGDLDTDSARELLGTDSLLWNILKEYYQTIPRKSALIKDLKEQEDWKAYTIEVHALKSASKQIGATKLSKLAADLEKAGNEKDIQTIQNNTDIMLEKYISYIDVLKPFCGEQKNNEEKEVISREQLLLHFERMMAAIDDLDMDQMEDVIHDLSHYSYPKEQEPYFDELKIAVGNIDVDQCEEIMDSWKKEL